MPVAAVDPGAKRLANAAIAAAAAGGKADGAEAELPPRNPSCMCTYGDQRVMNTATTAWLVAG